MPVDGLATDGANSVDGVGSRRRENSYVSVACLSCRKTKRKCDGDDPCGACHARGLTCIVDESKDGRRGRKRTLDQLYSKADALDVLLTSLQSSDDKSVRDLIMLIRDEASLVDVVQHAKSMLRQSEHYSISRARIRHTVLDIASLIDEPPIRVPAKPWTDVTDDDNAVSHLISIYFTWQHYGYPSVDQDIFVREMNSKTLSSPFCSPFLVNCLLLIACLYTDHPSAFADPDDPSSRGVHFLKEATRLWIIEQENVSLTNLQAMPSFISGNTALGKDRLALLHASHSIAMCTELIAEVKKRLKRGQREFESTDFQRSFTLALWAAFQIQTEMAVVWSKPFDIKKPSRTPPYTAEELQLTSLWQPYPKAGPPASYKPFLLAIERYKLYEIASDLRVLVLSGTPQDSPLPGYIVMDHDIKLDRLQNVEKKLLEWHESLPSDARTGDMDNSNPTGPLTDLHLAYNSFRISAASLVLRMTGLSETKKNDIAKIITDACRSNADIFEWLQRTIGLTHFSVYHVHASTLSAYGLFEYLSQPGITDAFHTMIVALSAASRRWTLARGIIRMVWIEVQQRKLDRFLNPSTLSLLKLSAVDSWGPEDHRLFERCAYPNYAVIGERGRLLSEMGDLLEEYSQLYIEHGIDPKQDS